METKKYSDELLRCSFCGKTEIDVEKLIAGKGVYICDECVRLCNEILDFEGDPEEFAKMRKEISAEKKSAEPPESTREKLRCCICGQFAEENSKPVKTAFGELIFCDKCREKLSTENFIENIFGDS